VGRSNYYYDIKKGDPEEPENYRPIALANTLMQIYTQLIAHMLADWQISTKFFRKLKLDLEKGEVARIKYLL